jgi:hypothetical protein
MNARAEGQRRPGRARLDELGFTLVDGKSEIADKGTNEAGCPA